MELISTIEITINILSFIGGMFFLYLTAHTKSKSKSKSKSKNKALLKDIKSLEGEEQKVIAKYRTDTENIKNST
jgi:threonine/homoserine/homoserine lactone efflux protein